MELVLGQQEPLGHIASYPSREEPAHIVARTWCFDRDSLRRPFPTYRPPPQGPLRRDWGGAQDYRRVAGRVRARVNSNFFTLTELTCWADGIWVEGRGVATACHNYYFRANRGLVSVAEARGRSQCCRGPRT